MPSRRGHTRLSRTLMPWLPKKLVDEVNRALDAPSAVLGPGHRVLFHDPLSAALMGAGVARSMGFPASWGMAAALLHIGEDQAVSKIPQPWRAMLIQMLEQG